MAYLGSLNALGDGATDMAFIHHTFHENDADGKWFTECNFEYSTLKGSKSVTHMMCRFIDSRFGGEHNASVYTESAFFGSAHDAFVSIWERYSACVFVDAWITNSTIRKAEFFSCTFNHTYIHDTTIESTVCKECDFVMCQFYKTSFTDVDCESTTFYKCVFRQCNGVESLPKDRLIDCIIEGEE